MIDRLPDGRWRCRYGVAGSQCELDAQHHGACTVGRAQAFNLPPPCGAPTKGGLGWNSGPVADCPECERLEAEEVLRLASGGELRPLQKAPSWLKAETQRRKQLTWARRMLGLEASP